MPSFLLRHLSSVRGGGGWGCDPHEHWEREGETGREREREDNWLVAAKRSQRHCLWILRCRAFLSLNRRSPTVSGCSPASRERELAVDHREEERERERGGGREGGIRKDTAGIIGLWQPSVHSDVAFGSFDVGPSYH